MAPDTTVELPLLKPEAGANDVVVHEFAIAYADMTTVSKGLRVAYEFVPDRGKTAATDLSDACAISATAHARSRGPSNSIRSIQQSGWTIVHGNDGTFYRQIR